MFVLIFYSFENIAKVLSGTFDYAESVTLNVRLCRICHLKHNYIMHIKWIIMKNREVEISVKMHWSGWEIIFYGIIFGH